MSPGPSEALRLLTAAADAASRALFDARAGHGRAELAAEVGIGGDGAPTRGSPHPIVRGRPGLRGRAGPAGRSGLADDRANRPGRSGGVPVAAAAGQRPRLVGPGLLTEIQIAVAPFV